MAKYGCSYNVYSNDTFTESARIASFRGVLGVADKWDGAQVADDCSEDYTFYIRHIRTQYEAYSLGIQYTYTVSEQEPQKGLWFPLSWSDDYNGVKGNWELVLDSGVIVRIYSGINELPNPGSWNAYRVTVTDPKNGVVYDATDTYGRAYALFPFGNAWAQIGNYTYGGPQTRGATFLARDEVGFYGLFSMYLIRPNYDKPFGMIAYVEDEMQPFFRAVFNGASGIDPYDQGDPTQPGGGDPDPPGPDEDTDFPPEPTFSSADSGMITLFSPTDTQLKSLAAYMWSSFDLNAFKKIFADPADCILGLSVLPITVTKGTPDYLYVGNINTQVQMYKAPKQYETLDCQSVFVGKKYGSYLDFAPYTKVECYLPFIGTVPLDVNDVMGKNVHLLYRFDIISGSCCAMIAAGGKQLYTYIGQCSASIPITGHDWTNVINGALNVAANVGLLIASQGATAPTGIPAIASATINAAQQNVQKSGALSGAGGILGPLTPYLIITRPRSAWPKDLKAYEGYPSFINSNLNELKGYTEVYKIHLENVPATGDELNEIERLLQEGVIL